MEYFKGSGAAYLNEAFAKLKAVAVEPTPLPKGFGKSAMPVYHAKAGAVGGMYFIMEFAKVNSIQPLPVAEQARDLAETHVRNLFERAWVHEGRPVERMKGRFLCDLAVGYKHLRDQYEKQYPNVHMPGAMTVSDDDGTTLACMTGSGLRKKITSELPKPRPIGSPATAPPP